MEGLELGPYKGGPYKIIMRVFRPGGQIMPTTVLQAPSIFQTLRRPCQHEHFVKM